MGELIDGWMDDFFLHIQIRRKKLRLRNKANRSAVMLLKGFSTLG